MSKTISASEHPEATRGVLKLKETMKREAIEKADENPLFALSLKYFYDNDLDPDEAVKLATNELRKIWRMRLLEKRMERYD